MIADAHLGKFQLILTKEVSRFSRNILDTITYTRELKALGVGVEFMNDGINSLEPDVELWNIVKKGPVTRPIPSLLLYLSKAGFI